MSFLVLNSIFVGATDNGLRKIRIDKIYKLLQHLFSMQTKTPGDDRKNSRIFYIQFLYYMMLLHDCPA